MPATTARNRLVDYYQSQYFADDVVGQVAQDPDKAKLYRQHIVNRLNKSLQDDGSAITEVMTQDQERFVRGDMPKADLVLQARLYALQWVASQTRKSEQ